MAASKYDQYGAGAAPHEHAESGLLKAAGAVLRRDDLTAEEKIEQIAKLLKAAEKIKGDLGADEGDTAADKVVERIALALRLGKGQRRLSERVRPVRTPRELAVRLFGRGHFCR